jgi:hypothetical protein
MPVGEKHRDRISSELPFGDCHRETIEIVALHRVG